MANTYSWTFSAFDCYPEHAGATDVVFTVHWTRYATDGEGHTASIYGTVGVQYEEGQDFVPFGELTPEIVASWVTEALGAEAVAAQEVALDQLIQNQITPPVVTRSAPWLSEVPPSVE